jgi:hypothetical protein
MLTLIDDDTVDDPDLAQAMLKALILFLDAEPEDTRQRLAAWLEEAASRGTDGAQEVVGAMFANL